MTPHSGNSLSAGRVCVRLFRVKPNKRNKTGQQCLCSYGANLERTMAMQRFLGCWLVVVMLVVVVMGSKQVGATTISLDFNSLPSAQGWTYIFDAGIQPIPEPDAFSVGPVFSSCPDAVCWAQQGSAHREYADSGSASTKGSLRRSQLSSSAASMQRACIAIPPWTHEART